MGAPRQPTLFRRYPQAAARIPWVCLGELPTPVEVLALPEDTGGSARVLVKRDDRTSPLYGGNKVRALEFLLGEALARESDAVLTAGALGSHHVTATALFAHRLGLEVQAFLWDHPHAPRGNAATQPLERLGVAPRRYSRPTAALAALLWHGWRLRRQGRRPYLLPPGGACARGVLGFVDAALELSEQIAAGEAETPDAVWIACGTGASAAGLSVGLALAGIPARVRTVRVTPRIVCNRFRIAQLQAGACRILRAAGVPVPGPIAPMQLLHDAYAPGYAAPHPAATAAVTTLARQGLPGDITYTGRVLAALLRHAPHEGGTHLFWHTLSAVAAPTD